ncbi:MAG TPA: hypothetical protein VFP68_01345 [Burkholderiaceae bacterium]|nr:hypothetical protein [Burkholderiaceae bacterium]
MASLQSKFAALWQASLEAEVPLENGGVITATPDGVVRLVNCVEYPVPNSMVFDTTLPPSHKPLGTFHTHPTQVGFHPADLAGMFGMRFAFMMLQNGTSTQSLLLATKKTPSKIDKDAISNLYSRLLMTYGPNRVSKEFALTVAKSLHLAYYEGSGGVLARVHPKLKAPDYEMLGCLARWLGKSSDDVRHGIAIFAPGYSASRYDPTEELKIDDIVHYLSATGGNYSAYDVSHWKCVPNSAIVSVTDEGGIPHTLLFERNKNGHTQLTGGNGEQYRTKNFQVSYCIALCRN